MKTLKHHVQEDVAEDRPGYRDSREKRAVKVYTINLESRHLLVQNVHALGVTRELLELFSLYGDIDQYRIMDEYPSEEFCDTYMISYVDIRSSRVAKKKLDDHSFYGKDLHVSYASEYESVADVRKKLRGRRTTVLQRLSGTSAPESSRPRERGDDKKQTKHSSSVPTHVPPATKTTKPTMRRRI